MVYFLIASYAVYQSKMFLYDWWIHFALRKTIGPSFIISYTLIGPTVRYDITWMSSDLAPEETWTEATHAWVLVKKLVGMKGVNFFNEPVPDDIYEWYLKGIPRFQQDWVHVES